MISVKAKPLLLFFLSAVLLIAAAAILVFGGFLPHFEEPEYSADDFGGAQFSYRITDYSELSGWLQDDLTLAFETFLESCRALADKADENDANVYENLGVEMDISLGGKVADWREACTEAQSLRDRPHTGDDSRRGSIRNFFEFYFRPIQILSVREPLPDGPARRAGPAIDETGVFTGYFEPAYEATRFRVSAGQAPLYPRPDNLVDVDLGAFRESLKGERIAGRIEGGRLVPYPDRAAINAGALGDIVEPIAWLEANDLFFLQIQGSGQLIFGRDHAIRVNYAGQNGRPYTAIGRVMVDRGIMPLEDISMQTIREWLDNSNPSAAKALREENESYVFFRSLGAPAQNMGPPGAQGVPLTPGRSLAVDRRYHTLGAPIWVDIDPVEGGGARIRRLMIAQDTGGAIRGPVRGDFYWGAGPVAGDIAGKMNARGQMFVLIPRTIAARLADQKPS